MTDKSIGSGNMDPKAIIFNEKINELKDKFFAVLEDFKKYYVFYNKNPEVDEYQNFYSSSKNNLQVFNRDIFLLTNSIQKMIEELDTNNIELNKDIAKLKVKYDEMTKLQDKLRHTEDGSAVLIDDTKEEYNIQYRQNLILFIGIFGLIAKSFQIFGK